MSWKKNFIKQYGEAAYAKQLERYRAYYNAHKEAEKARNKKYREEYPEQVRVNNQEASRKGGSRYNKNLKDQHTGIPGYKNRIRRKHAHQYKPYKDIIAPDSQLHHQWNSQSASYTGLALVEADQHMHGIIDMIKILEGEITIFTEEDIRKGSAD